MLSAKVTADSFWGPPAREDTLLPFRHSTFSGPTTASTSSSSFPAAAFGHCDHELFDELFYLAVLWWHDHCKHFVELFHLAAAVFSVVSVGLKPAGKIQHSTLELGCAAKKVSAQRTEASNEYLAWT